MMLPCRTLFLVVIAGFPSLAVAAKPQLDKPSPALQHLLDCRQISDNPQRLACYDAQAQALDIATARKDVIVLDRQQVAETKRGLFGFTLPHIALFDTHDEKTGKDAPANEETRLETTIKSVHRNGNGFWVLVLEDDAVWEEVETSRNAYEPRSGMKIVIKRATMGSYFATLPGSIFLRIRRVN